MQRRKIRAIFVTGTDTGIGKTVITGLLARFLLDRGYRVITQKWIQTGSRNFPEDIRAHLKLMQKRKQHIKNYLSYVAPYIFEFASSPHLAARLKKRKIDGDRIKRNFKFLLDKFNYVIVEGIGGALVPFNERRLVIDIARELNLPILIVANNKLGAINHTLLTIEAIRRRNMKIMGIIFNNQAGKVKKSILRDNPRIVKRLTGEDILGVLPRIKDRDLLYKKFISIGKRILAVSE